MTHDDQQAAHEITKLRARVAELEAQMQQEKLTAISRLAGGVAHDLNNMLTPILAYGNMVLEDLPADSPLREYMKEVVQAGDRALLLTKSLQGLRIKTIGLLPIEINEAARAQIEKLRAGLSADFTLDVQLDEAAGCVMGENGAVERIVDELIRNSIQAMPAGGALAVSTRRGTDAFREFVVLTVKDEGSGMTPETRQHLGEPYFTTRPKGTAKGLGLSFVYTATMRAGGFVRCASEPGSGTEMAIHLRRAPAAPQGL